MIITLKRIYCKGTFTLGALQIQTESNKEFLMNRYFCDGREEVYNFKTMIHEFGHALGLGHCPSGGDVMSTGNVAVSTLSQFDMDSYDAAYELYSVY